MEELEILQKYDQLDVDGYVRLCYCVAEMFDISEYPREETWLKDMNDQIGLSIGEYIQRGEIVLSLPQIIDEKECNSLVLAAQEIAASSSNEHDVPGRSRLCVADLDTHIVERCEAILLRVMDRLDLETPSIYEHLFRPSVHWGSRQPRSAKNPGSIAPLPELLVYSSLRELYMAGQLEWSENEPAINVYTTQGGFGPHKDHLALTVLIPLTDQITDFQGGGTAFWSPTDSSLSTDGAEPKQPPATVLTPPKGTALIFGGDVTHSGVPVDRGSRVVLVASFSTRTPASPPDRINGLLSCR